MEFTFELLGKRFFDVNWRAFFNLCLGQISGQSFVISVDTPQFFPSSVSTIALLETLLSFVIASASPQVVQRVETFHRRRHELGIYLDNPET